MFKSITLALVFTACLFAISMNAQGPKISIQSTLKDISGKAIPDGDVGVTFRLYTEQVGGTALWEETTVVTVVGGIYSHKLGSVMALNPSNFGNTLYLGITVAGGQELAPRTELTAAPYAVSVSSLAANGQSASFLSDGTFIVSGKAQINGRLHLPDNNSEWEFTIGGTNHGILRETDRLNFADNGTGRMLLYDSGLNQLHSHSSNGTELFVNGGQKFRTDVFGTITSGRHAVYGNLDMYANGNINTQGGDIYLGNDGNLHASDGTNPGGVTRWVSVGDSDTGLRSSSDGTLEIMSNNGAVGIIRNGRMGVNTSNPLAPLHVTWQNGDFGPFAGSSYDYTGLSFYNEGGMHWINNNANNPLLLGDPNNGPALTHIGIISDGSIVSRKGLWSCNNLTVSDKRIKDIVGLSNSSEDLMLLNKIKITDYVMKDRVQDRNKYKKVIAQEIQEIFPQAVTSSRNVLPDIFAQPVVSKFSQDKIVITMGKEHGLKTGDHVDVLSKEAKLTDVEVLEIVDDKTFVISSDKELTKIFVYGKYVDDFLGVDYDALSMLNISATQELYKRLISLEEENKSLKTTTAALEERMGKIEALLSDNRNNAGSSANIDGQK